MDGFVNASMMLRPCVYALAWKGEVVYVGASRRAVMRLYTHVRARQGRVLPRFRKLGFRFDEVWIRECGIEDLGRVEREMIERYRPRHNVQHKPPPVPTAPLVLRVRNTVLTVGAAKPKPPLVFERRI